MASRSGDDFLKVENEVFQKLKADDEVDYKKFQSDPEAKKKAEAAMKKTYEELTRMIAHTASLDEALGHLSPDRQDLIKTSFRLQSFNVDIQHETDGSVNLRFASLSGTPLSFVSSVVKLDSNTYEQNRYVLAARIIFEVVMLLLNLIVLAVKPSSKAVAEAMEKITTILSFADNFIDDVDKMVDAARRDDNEGVALAIIACLVDLYKIVGSQLFSLFKIFLMDMSWLDIIIAIAQAACYIATIVLSAGAAAVAKVISLFLDATDFLRKLLQMEEFKGALHTD
ncbi:uncharacterized protein LOC123545621 [Mercenaria mercenaria]|uniref:uncharacterized protein LOC123545621 n=1 Tax=Mercenaria mercenaria TaxID=6596 RepID=UPI00234E5AA4|nr:uncharacterized protein LOC123545621 [Mercenaria mercenaria]